MLADILRWTGEPGVVAALLALAWRVYRLEQRDEQLTRRLVAVETKLRITPIPLRGPPGG